MEDNREYIMDPHNWNNIRRYLIWTFILIVVLLMTNLGFAKSKDKLYCVMEKIYSSDGEYLLESKMVCRDGNIGPTYWEIFAEFYYGNADNIPEYCRYVNAEGQGFFIPKKMCLNKDGQWEKP